MPEMPGPSPLPINAPQAAPMQVPSAKEGLQAKSKVEIQQALQLLKSNLKPDIFPVDGPEWKALYSSVKSLAKLVGEEQGKDMSQAGLKLIASTMSPKGLPGVMGQQGGGAPMAGPSPMPIGGM
jgi:hypothetical protein